MNTNSSTVANQAQSAKRHWLEYHGLLGVAVLALLLSQLQIQGLMSGHIGLEILLVVSGFLLTNNLKQGLQAGTFSFWRFWTWQVERAVPALVLVLFVTSVAGYWLVLYPLDYLEIGKTLMVAALFVSNLFFWWSDVAAAEEVFVNPFWHIWPLAAAAQFLLIWSICFCWLAVLRQAKSALVLVILAAGVSLWQWPSAAFLLLPWLILSFGSLLALLDRRPRSRLQAELAAGVGVGLIVCSFVWLSGDSWFLGTGSIWAVLGTGLLIWSHTQYSTTFMRVLTFAPLVRLGMLAYPLYLWHWPVLVLGAYVSGVNLVTDLPTLQLVGLLGLSFCLSVLTYYLVKIMRHYLAGARCSVWLGALVIAAVFGHYIVMQAGLPQRTPQPAGLVAQAVVDFGPDWHACVTRVTDLNYNHYCQFGLSTSSTTKDKLLLWGDSQAGSILPAIRSLADETEVSILTYIGDDCLPLSSVGDDVREQEHCTQIELNVWERIAAGGVTEVLLVGDWSAYSGLHSAGVGGVAAEAAFSERVNTTITRLKESGVRVTVLLSVPVQSDFDTRILFEQAAYGGSLPHYVLQLTHHERLQSLNQQVWQMTATEHQLNLLDPTTVLCEEELCETMRDGVILYRDARLLNATGALYLKPLLAEWLE